MAQAVKSLNDRLDRFGRGRVLSWVIVAAAITVVVTIVLSIVDQAHQVSTSTADAELASIVGPPCPTIAPAAFGDRDPKPDKVFDFDGVTFAHQFGHVDCSAVASGDLLGQGSYPVCQFASPAVVSARTRTGTAYFNPGIGRAATVFARDGAVRCVMAAPAWSGL